MSLNYTSVGRTVSLFFWPLLITLFAGCSGSGFIASDLPDDVPSAPGDLRERADLRELVERQARRDTLHLIAALDSSDAIIRSRALLGLSTFADASSTIHLWPSLGDSDPDVRVMAAFAIGQTGHDSSDERLLQLLRNERDMEVQQAIITALGKTGGEIALEELAAMSLPPELESSRAHALTNLGLRGFTSPVAVNHLVELLASTDQVTRHAAAYYFGRMPSTSSWIAVAPTVREAMSRLHVDDPALGYLVSGIGRLNDADDRPMLRSILGSNPDWRTRVNAARALNEPSFGDIPVLIHALDDPSHHVAVTAAQALARHSLSEDVLNRLITWQQTHPDSWHVWTEFIPAFVKSNRTDFILDAYRSFADDNGYARAAIISKLSSAADPQLAALLFDAAADQDARVAYAALEAINTRRKALGNPTADPVYFSVFAEGIRRGDVATIYAAAPALADSAMFALGAGEVLRETYATMEIPVDVESMTAIIRAHGVARDTASLNFLVDIAMEAPHPVLRNAAAESLDERFGEGIDFEATGHSAPAFPEFHERLFLELGAHPRMILETDRGIIELLLLPDWAPITTLTISRLAISRHYDGIPFHRVVPNFVVQGGDFARADGFGGPSYFLPSEFTPLAYETGTLGMASAGPDTEGSQFFITHSPQPHLNGRYTIFGFVLSGQNVVDELRIGDRIIRARIITESD